MKAKGNCELYLFILPQQSLFVLISLRELVSFSGYDNVEELSAIIFMESSLMASCMTSLGSYLVRIIVKSISFLLVSLLLARSNQRHSIFHYCHLQTIQCHFLIFFSMTIVVLPSLFVIMILASIFITTDVSMLTSAI